MGDRGRVFLTCDDPPFFWVLKPMHRCFLKPVWVLNKFLRGEIAENFVAVVVCKQLLVSSIDSTRQRPESQSWSDDP